MKSCKNCGNEIILKNKKQVVNVFCGASCAATYNNKLYPKRVKSFIPLDCLYCGKLVDKPRPNKYCNATCTGAHKTQKIIQSWVETPCIGTAKNGGLIRVIRLHLIAQAGSKCSLCGWGELNPATGKAPLEVDHIDGDAFNNNPEKGWL